MILLIDAGNTRIKWALAEADAAPGMWLRSGVVLHAELDQLAAIWRTAGAERPITRVLMANVAGAALGQRVQQALPEHAIHHFASLPQLAGLRNGYRNPAQLGCDRFAAAIGARAMAPGPALIVANCGTASTIDAISADGVFLGGMILPGLGLMAQSLARNTANLPQIGAGALLPAGFSDNTEDAILSGCLAAQVGAIERAYAAFSHSTAPNAVLCIVSGGAAPYITPSLSLPHRVVDNIVLIGLHAAAGAAPC